MDFVVWRSIKNFDNNYEVSSDGRIKEIDKDGNCIYLKKTYNVAGYSFVELLKNGKYKSVAVDFLVASTFINNPERKEFIRHKNGNNIDCNVENLQWFDLEEYQTRNDGSKKVYRPSEEQKAIISLKNLGKRNARAREVVQYNFLGEVIKIWDCIADAERSLNIKGISRACKKKYATAGGYKWEYR